VPQSRIFVDRACIRQLLRKNVKRFRGGLEFKAKRLWLHLTLGWRVMKKGEKYPATAGSFQWLPIPGDPWVQGLIDGQRRFRWHTRLVAPRHDL